MNITKVLVPSGVLGLGFDIEALRRGIKNKPDIISIDGGSTDSGPASLGSGTSKYSRSYQIRVENTYASKKGSKRSLNYWYLWYLWY